MQNFCFEEVESALKKLNSRLDGLSEEEARARLGSYGKNAIESGKKTGIFRLFFSQFSDFMTILLIIAAAISGVIAVFSEDGGELTDTIIILAIILLNAVVGSVQQFRADKAIDDLKKLSASQCKVRRGGKTAVVPCEDITVGDIVLLEEGNVVPADCRIVEENGLKCDESALTGESVAVEKNSKRIHGNKVALGGMTNTLFGSTYVVSGNCTAVVTAVGMQTEMGKIAEMLKDGKQGPTPLEKSLSKLGKAITYFVLAVTVLIFILGVAIRQDGILKNFVTAVAVAVAAIPEGLPAVVTIIMSMGVQRMSRRHVIIRKLKSVETLGCCSVICTDKTGTLTQNRLKVSETFTLSDENPQSALLTCMRVCTTVKGERGSYVGDPTEIALRNYADDMGFDIEFKKLGELPFTSERKMMSVAAETEKGGYVFSKGAPDLLINKCSYVAEGQKIRELTKTDRAAILSRNDEMSDKALRVLAFAYRPYEGSVSEDNLIFIGLCGMYDGLKKGAAEAVAECGGAGIRTVMITGDHVRTAFSVAEKVGIAKSMDEVVTGEEIEELRGRERDEKIMRANVFARVSPRHKKLIVACLKRGGEVVAMTGDGVNDAPSIKSADIGISMGSGTDVTKSASDMVITDDNFATIVSAVREGRRISSNISKTIRFFVSTNLAEVLAILIASVFFFRFDFLLSTQLLWLNLITDSFPVLALGMEKEDADIMLRPPERLGSSLFSRNSLLKIAVGGIYITAATVGVFAAALPLWGNAVATTMTFLTLSFAELFHAFNVRSGSRSAFSGLLSNKALIITAAVGIAVNVLLCVTPLSSAFGLVPIDWRQWLIVFAASFSVIPVFELFKFFLRRKKVANKSSSVAHSFARRKGGLPNSRRCR